MQVSVFMKSQFLSELTNQGFRVTWNNSKGVATNVRGAVRAEFDYDVSGIFAGAVLVQPPVLAQLRGEGIISIESRGGGRSGGCGHG